MLALPLRVIYMQFRASTLLPQYLIIDVWRAVPMQILPMRTEFLYKNGSTCKRYILLGPRSLPQELAEIFESSRQMMPLYSFAEIYWCRANTAGLTWCVHSPRHKSQSKPLAPCRHSTFSLIGSFHFDRAVFRRRWLAGFRRSFTWFWECPPSISY